MSRTETIRKKKLRKLRPWVWLNVAVNWATYMVNTTVSRSPQLNGIIPPLVPMPTDGDPVLLGDPDGAVVIDPGVQSKNDEPLGDSTVSDYRPVTGEEPRIEVPVQWTGDENIVYWLSPLGPWGASSSFWGGGKRLRETNALIIYTDDLRDGKGYEEDNPPVFLYLLIWRLAIIPVVTENDGLPDKFKFTAFLLEGTDQNTGKCFPDGMKVAHRYRLNLRGQPVNKSGQLLNPTAPSVYPVLFNSAMGVGL